MITTELQEKALFGDVHHIKNLVSEPPVATIA
jgi:hypothetical protein